MEKNLYIIISYTSKEKEKEQFNENKFLASENQNQFIQCIHSIDNFENEIYFYKKVVKINKALYETNEEKKFYCELDIGDNKYQIIFENNGKTFIYDVELEIGKKLLFDIIWTKIETHFNYEYDKKFELFLESLENNEEKNLENELYKETLDLYLKKQSFSLLISLFVKIYKKNELCNELISNFRKMNENSIDKDNVKNMDRKSYLKKYISKFNEIKSDAGKIIEINKYNIIDFYGIILCYFNFYEYENFLLAFNELLNSQKPEVSYELLFIYNNHLINPINQNLKFFNELINYSLKNKEFSKFKIALNYIKGLEIFINVIEENKEEIYNKYIKTNKILIEAGENLKFDKEENKNNILNIINKINSILDFSEKNNIFFLYFQNYFWKYLLINYKEANADNILICYKLRQTFIKYYNLAIKHNEKKDNFYIKANAINYYEFDEFASILNHIIKIFISNNNKLTNIEKLAYITEYNPYYIEERYSSKVNSEIFELFDLDNINEEFIENFRRMNFENIFRYNISEFLSNMTLKIKNIFDLGIVIKLINIKNIEDKNLFFFYLKKRYNIIKKEIEKLTDSNLQKAITFLVELTIINYSYEKKEKKFDFIENIIKALPKEIKTNIFIQIIKICINNEDNAENDIDYKNMKNYIFAEFINKVEHNDDINNIIKLINCLENKDKNIETQNENLYFKKVKERDIYINEFLNKLFEKNLFNKDDFFSNNSNSIKIILLDKLYNEQKIKINDEEYYENICKLLKSINSDLEGNIIKKKFDEFLTSEESFIKQRLNLLKIIFTRYDPNYECELLKKKKQQIDEIINQLKYIKNNIIIYYKEYYKDIIQRLIEVIENVGHKKIKEFSTGKTKELIKDCENLKEIADKIEKVKNFLLFNVIYDMNSGSDEDKNFKISLEKMDKIGEFLLQKNIDVNEFYTQYKDIIDKIEQKMSNSEEKEQKKFIQNLIEYFNINNTNLIDDLIMLFKSKKYEQHINSIIFFFEYFEKNNKNWNDIMPPEKYKNISKKDFNEIKNLLIGLQKNEIYDYQNIKNYIKIFTCLYNKKEEIEFLFNKEENDIDILKEKIQLNNKAIKVEDLLDTKECICNINKMKEIQDNFKILAYIKSLNDKAISQFKNYSKIYMSIIELYINYNESNNIFEKIIAIIKDDLTINIYQDTIKIYFYYKDKNKYENITKKNLIDLNNKINIEKNENENENKTYKPLMFYKKVISNFEMIYEYIKILISKGNNLPINIIIKSKLYDIQYFLDDKIINLEEIINYLSNVKDSYISQLDSIYKENPNLRFLYGNQFISLMRHIEIDLNIDSLLRYILNNSTDKKIFEGYKTIQRSSTSDYINHYELYNQNSFENLSMYITSLFKNNNKTLEGHYAQMVIKSENNNKGFYLLKCEKKNMKRVIINLFLDKIGQFPIAQNILITSKETSFEELKTFLYRALLCNYNTLFVVEINNSFTEYQQSTMNTYIEQLLLYKNEKYNEENNEIIDKKDITKYIDSCLVFIYNEDNNYNSKVISFLKETDKFEVQTIQNCTDNVTKINSLIPEYNKNIKIITSDQCGLGKSGMIKRLIKDNNKKYFYFNLGGKLNKNNIYDKLINLLNEIKLYKNEEIAIHLDLFETGEIDIMNEFLFSFLITKFYIYKENIIYLSKDISIFIEIPNCFENFLEKFEILNIFNKENISFEKMPEPNFSDDIINIIEKILSINTNEKIKEFVDKYICIENYEYTYHQINIFINILIEQFKNIKNISNFFDTNKNVEIKLLVEKIAKSTQYFINTKLSKSLIEIEKNNKEENNYINILSKIYNDEFNNIKFPYPLIFINQEKNKYNELCLSDDSENYHDTIYYLEKLKEYMDIPNDIMKDEGELKSLMSILEEKNNNYIISSDNFKKMILLYYRIKSNIPVIIMGDTGCGKTLLAIKLNQILNNGKTTIEIINVNSEITNEKLEQIIEEKNEKAKKIKNEELWLFFDEINNCLSLTLITEIYIKRAFNGKSLNDNIRLIGAYRPYILKKRNSNKNNNKLLYLVQPLNQSLLYYVFNFGSIDSKSEKIYISNMIEKLFTKSEKDLYESTIELISQCHIYLRQTFNSSFASLRDISRFIKLVKFFDDYFTKKNNYESRINNARNNKLRSIICSINICYFMKLKNDKWKTNFEIILRPALFYLINNEKTEEKNINFLELIKNEELKTEIRSREEEKKLIHRFSDFLIIEQNYLINQMELDKGICKNNILKENIFLLFVSTLANIPLIIIGNPGNGKSLSVQVINKSMKGKYSTNKFLKLFPKIIITYFHITNSIKLDDIENIFLKAEKKLEYYKNNKLDIPISVILFNQLELSKKSGNNLLEKLINKLDYYSNLEKGINFIGISNCSLDPAMMNRNLVLYVPDLYEKLDELISFSRNIAESFSLKIKNDIIFEILAFSFFEYKNQLRIIKELIVIKKYFEKNKTKKEEKFFEYIKDSKEFKNLMKKEDKINLNFHGNVDFYNLIKSTANDLSKFNNISEREKVDLVIKNIERNFGGIEYEIDINFDLILDDIREKVKLIKYLIEDYEKYDYNKTNENIRLNSVFLFKKIYNLQCDKLAPFNKLKIDKTEINEYNLNNCINKNIKDTNSRYLLIEIKQSLIPLIYQYIKFQNPFKDMLIYDGSPFINDNNEKYMINKIKNIQEVLKEDKLIIIENLSQIHPFLFNLYDMKYEVINDNKYIRVCLDNYNEQLTLVNDKFRIIILIDENSWKQFDINFLYKFEKMHLSFDKLLDNQLKIISKNLIEEINLTNTINKYNKINYSLMDLLINCGDEEIEGLIYYLNKVPKIKNNEYNNYDEKYDEEKINEDILKENIIDKIYKILPQDIICILHDNNIIRKKYDENKNIFNLKDYINNEENKKYKISIVYTFTTISNIVEGINKKMSFMISDIKSENEFKNIINEIKNKNENNKFKQDKYDYICIHVEQSNSKNIKFITNFILNNYKKDIYNYIIIIHINRNFNKEIDEKICSLPDVNPDINQLFIDNLNGNNSIKLKYLLENNIKSILENNEYEFNLDNEFDKTLFIFIKKELNEKGFNHNDAMTYIHELKNYMNDEKLIKKKIIEAAYKLIEKSVEEENCKDIIRKIYSEHLINKYTIDIISFLINYIKEEIFDIYLKNIFRILEDDNILTTLLESKRNNYKYINKTSIEEIIKKYLDEKIFEKLNPSIKYNCKFLFNYNIPAFYNFFVFISDYIHKNISLIYFNNEKKLRKINKEDNDIIIKEFHEREKVLINNTYNKLINENLFIMEIMKYNLNELILRDYITFYLQKYRNNYDSYSIDDIYHKIIELLLKLKFTNENIIDINNTLIKIIWIESNINYILNLLKIIEYALAIFDNDEIKLYNIIECFIFKEGNLHYKSIEMNKCYYILLLSILYCIFDSNKTQLKRKNEIEYYYYSLKKMNDIIKNLIEDLSISLNEIYVIDFFIKLLKFFKKYNSFEKIYTIKKNIRDNTFIIHADLNIDNIYINIYDLIINDDEKEYKNDKDYYDILKYILFMKIRNISDINNSFDILENLLEEKEIIKKSTEIFQILFFKNDKFIENKDSILNEGNILTKLIENKLTNIINNNIILEEALIHLFEKNILNYFNNILLISDKESIYLENEPLQILKDCIKLLDNYNNKHSKIHTKNKNKEVSKLFCLSYIKIFCYIFIQLFNDKSYNFKELKKIIAVFNEDNSINKMIRIYIYKILYNNNSLDFFNHKENITKYKLDEYKDFNNFFPIKDMRLLYKINYEIKTLNEEFYSNTHQLIEKYKNCKFENQINKNDIKTFYLDKCGIDNLYISSFNSILVNINNQMTFICKNFYNNLLLPLFKEEKEKYKLLLKAMKLFYSPEAYSKIKKEYTFNSNNAIPLLFGYRYCLNELFYQNIKGIYYPLYNDNNNEINKILSEKYYPGNDTKINLAYYDILNHFKLKSEEGCYVCLCEELYYHCIFEGFPGKNELNMVCPKCLEKIGTYLEEKNIKIIKKDNYFRIFNDINEIEEIKKDKINGDKLNEINYMTLEQFKKDYIYKRINKKGIYITDKNNFKKENKFVRYLSPISFRLLNYILYTHLFFAKLLTEKKDFDNYLPKGMSWIETLNECWNLIKIELLKKNIYSIDKFMNCIFISLFPILNQEISIDTYEDLILLEKKLDNEINTIIENFDEKNTDNDIIKEDKVSFINILTEKYINIDDNKNNIAIDYPYYNHFYYTDYLNEKFIYEKLNYKIGNKYPVLKMYLEYKINNNEEKNNDLFNNFNLYNNVLNLLNEKYINEISKEEAIKTKLKDTKIYINNKQLFDNFIDFYNNLELKELYNKENISNDNTLNNFFIDGNNKFGKTYKIIYKHIIKQQNELIENLLDAKIDKGIFDANSKNKINVQFINENELFSLNLPKNIKFIDIVYNNSYRKIVDDYPLGYKYYNEYIINIDILEEKMTEILLKNKKMLNDNIIEFIYNNEDFKYKITNLFTLFEGKYKYKNKNNISSDKRAIHDFIKEKENNIFFYKTIINDFIELIKFLINNDIKVEDKIFEVIEKYNLKNIFSSDFSKFFEKNGDISIEKALQIFNIFLKCIFTYVISHMKKYQEKLNEKSKEKINNYYKKNNSIINKKDLSNAIRLFITLSLFQEEDKENKIKKNKNNIMTYLNSPDLWKNEIYYDKNFQQNLNELKFMDIKINQSISLYEFLGGDIEENFFEDDIKDNKDEENNNYDPFENSDFEENESDNEY